MPKRINEGDSATVVEMPIVVASYDSPDFTSRYKTAYKKLIGSLCSGERRKGMRTKTLYDNLFSLSVTKSVRVLAIRYYVARHCYWLIADLETDHDRYERKIPNFDLSPGLEVLRHVTQQREVELGAEASAAPYLYPEERKPNLAAQYNAIRRSASKYRNQMVRASEEQDEILDELKPNLTRENYLSLVTGPAGSGKSFLSCLLLKWLTERDMEAVFLASSKKLRVEQRKDWLLSIPDEADEDMVSFFNYLDFLKDIGLVQDDPDRDGVLRVPVDDGAFLSVVGDAHLRQYYEDVKKKFAKNRRRRFKASKAGGGGGGGGGGAAACEELSSFDDVPFDVFKQEFSIMLVSKVHYLSSGSSDSLYHNNESLKEELWQAFEGYKQKLEDEQLCNLSFFEFEPAYPYCVRVVLLDECFDLNRYQLKSLMNICSRLVIEGDLNQALGDTSNLMGFAESEIKIRGGDKFTLVGTHRSRQNIAAVGTSVLDYKQKLKTRRPAGVLRVESLLPYLGWVRFERKLIYKTDWFVGLSTAVICHQSEVQRVKDVCDTPLIFTVEQIKGLGYPRIIILNLLASSSDASRLIAKIFLSLLEKKGVSRSSIQSEDHAVLRTTHALYTAIMRGEVEVVFINEGPKKSYAQMAPFVDRMKSVVLEPHSGEPGVQKRVAIIDYLRERRRLRESGNLSQAHEVDLKIKEKLFLDIRVMGAPCKLCISSPQKSDLEVLRDLSLQDIKSQLKFKHFLGFLWANISALPLDPILVIDVFLRLREVFSTGRNSFKLGDALHDVSDVSLAGMIFRPGNSKPLMRKRIPLFLLSTNERDCQTLRLWLNAYESGVIFNFPNFLAKAELVKLRDRGVMRGSTRLHGLVQHGHEFIMRCLVISQKNILASDVSIDPAVVKDPLSVVSDWFSDVFDIESLLIKSASPKSLGMTPWHHLLSSDAGCQFIFCFMESSPEVFEEAMAVILGEALKGQDTKMTRLAFEALCDSHRGKLILERWFNAEVASNRMLVDLSIQSIIADDSSSKILLSIYNYPNVIGIFFDWLEANQGSIEKLAPLLKALLSDAGFFQLFSSNQKSLSYFHTIHEALGLKKALYTRIGELFQQKGDDQDLQVGFLSKSSGQAILAGWAEVDSDAFSRYVRPVLLGYQFDSGSLCLQGLHRTAIGRHLMYCWEIACDDFSSEVLRIVSSDFSLLTSLLVTEKGLNTLSICFDGDGDLSNLFEFFSMLSRALDELRYSVLKLIEFSVREIFNLLKNLDSKNDNVNRVIVSFFKSVESDYPFSDSLPDDDTVGCIMLLLGSASGTISNQVYELMAPLINKIDSPVQTNLFAKNILSLLFSQVVDSRHGCSIYACNQLARLEDSGLCVSSDNPNGFIVHFLSRNSKYNYFSDQMLIALSRHEVIQSRLMLGAMYMSAGTFAAFFKNPLLLSLEDTHEALIKFIKYRLSILSSKLNSKLALPVSRRSFSAHDLHMLKSLCDQLVYMGISLIQGLSSSEDSAAQTNIYIKFKLGFFDDIIDFLSLFLLESSPDSRGEVSNELIIQVLLFLSYTDGGLKKLVFNRQLIRIIASYASDKEEASQYEVPFLPAGSVFHTVYNPRDKLLSWASSRNYQGLILEALGASSLVDDSFHPGEDGSFSRRLLSNYAGDSFDYRQATGAIAQLVELLDSSYLAIQSCAANKIKEILFSPSGRSSKFSGSVLQRACIYSREILSSKDEGFDVLKKDVLEILATILELSDRFKAIFLQDRRLLDMLFSSYRNKVDLIFRICSMLVSTNELVTACLAMKSFQVMVSDCFYQSSDISFSLKLLALYLNKPMPGGLKLVNQFYSFLMECLPRGDESYFVFHAIGSKDGPRSQPYLRGQYWANFESFVKIIFSFFRLELTKSKSGDHPRLEGIIRPFLMGFLSAVDYKDFPQKMATTIKLEFLGALIALSKKQNILHAMASLRFVRLLFTWSKSVIQLRDRSLPLVSNLIGALHVSELRDIPSYASESYQVDLYLPYLESANDFLQSRTEHIVNMLSQLVLQARSDSNPSRISFDSGLVLILPHAKVVPQLKLYLMRVISSRPVTVNFIRSNQEVGIPCISQLFDFLLGANLDLKNAAIGVLSKLYENPEFNGVLKSSDSHEALLSTLLSKTPKSNPIRGEIRKRLAAQTKEKSVKSGARSVSSPKSAPLVGVSGDGGGGGGAATKTIHRAQRVSSPKPVKSKSSEKKGRKKSLRTQSMFEQYAEKNSKKSKKSRKPKKSGSFRR